MSPDPSIAARLLAETLLTPKEATRHPAFKKNGKACCVSLIYRMFQKGSGGIKLEFVRTARGLFTTAESCERFVERLTSGPNADVSVRSNRQREKSIDRAERELAEAGI